MPKSKSSLPLIKGYLPVRVHLPGWNGEPDETFFYTKEHTGDSDGRGQGSTLFVANTPVVPGVRSRLVLQSLLGRFGDIDRVTVVENPRLRKEPSQDVASVLSSWTTLASKPSFLSTIHSEGRFAHVVFTSTKEMKRALRTLGDVMTEKSKSSSDQLHLLPGLSLEKLEIQTLRDATVRITRQEKDIDSDADSDQEYPNDSQTGILAVAKRYRQSCKAMSRESLLEECNRAMQAYEDAEDEDRLRRESTKNQPDDDGFITVTYAAQSVGSKRDLEESGGVQHRKHGAKRSRKKRRAGGSEGGLTDFYRFQTKESRKKGLQDLRKKFEEDLAKVKKMKDERQYKPF